MARNKQRAQADSAIRHGRREPAVFASGMQRALSVVAEELVGKFSKDGHALP